MPFNRPLIIVVLLVAMALLMVRRYGGEETESVRRSRLIMGTVVEITASGLSRDDLDQAVDAAFAEMGRIEDLMSPSRAGSDVARLSAASGPVTVAPETAEVIALGREVAHRSGGAFDLTLGRLKSLWGIETEAPRVPSAGEIERALHGTGAEALRQEGLRVEKRVPSLTVDLGGIAKGYAVDRAIALLRAAGIERASVNAGGDIRLCGSRPDGGPWRIGIQHPRDPEKILATVALSDAAVVTSGDYERNFTVDGVLYHHLFDPRTGYPATRSQSVTVVAPTAALADALATAAFVLGPEAGVALLAEFPGVEGLIVGADGTPVLSAGLKGVVSWP